MAELLPALLGFLYIVCSLVPFEASTVFYFLTMSNRVQLSKNMPQMSIKRPDDSLSPFQRTLTFCILSLPVSLVFFFYVPLIIQLE